ncbi:MAG: DUF4236 domain-containing protein [Acidobacteria bacterium]|nr:DUF4236 domain-containing protein [Acidobacteriota bacterium]
MSIRFWRRLRLFPGVTLNISKTGFSLSFGIRGAHWTVGRGRRTGSLGIPGTGLFYRKESRARTNKSDNEDVESRDSLWDDFK